MNTVQVEHLPMSAQEDPYEDMYAALLDDRSRLGPVQAVPIDLLSPAGSPKVDTVDPGHVKELAESGVELPPIIVHRDTMRVVDGMHRLRAAVLRGADHIQTRFFDGAPADAMAFAVQVNVRLGRPPSLADRTTAAERVMRTHPHLSDRAIASATGLAAKTVSAIRARTPAGGRHTEVRVGRDGKSRPLSSAKGRRAAWEFIAANPGASLREIAKAAGISPGTARDVRARLHRGEDPVPPKQRAAERGPRGGGPRGNGPRSGGARGGGPHGGGAGHHRPAGGEPSRRRPVRDPGSVLRILRNDPAIRYALSGRLLLRLLDLHGHPGDWRRFADMVPAHCVGMVADSARECAEAWREFAERLEGRRDLKV
ncbi:ParB/RepB/Spo0J family partition protein [Sphaerisporangium aureirubrum]|uniref:ParB N-terminal domain-containing protein n=1 Tax=Sphaerisporangium aureirubrum TaxID=1544736 RepID=A0ABW1NWC1_9ACTN